MFKLPITCTPSHRTPSIIFALAILATFFAYYPGISGGLHFDDYHNLGGLAKINDAQTAIQFIFSGDAGPLGRPVALASFVPQAAAWPDISKDLLLVNVKLHLLNGALVVWLLYLLALAHFRSEKTAGWTSVLAGTIWMLLPILASSSLFAVQRMTTLSASAVLLGSIFYLYARKRFAYRPVYALFGMSGALFCGALLGVLTKENGILIFVFILIAELTILPRPRPPMLKLWRTWVIAALILPTMLLLFYLAYRFQYNDAMILRRGFTATERLMTQAGILWEYLYSAFIPNQSNLGPYHDSYPIKRDLLSPDTLIPVVAWAIVISFAAALHKKIPLLAFGVFWYLGGHALESTTLPLELYFEHRNYLPLIGPVFSVVAIVNSYAPRIGRFGRIGAAIYIIALGGMLFQTSSLWGNPRLSAEVWYINKPESVRAAQRVAEIIEDREGPWAARHVLSQFVESQPEADGVRLQVLALSCLLEPHKDHEALLDILENNLSHSSFQHGIPKTFEKIADLAKAGTCETIDIDRAYRLGISLINNRRFQAPIIVHNIQLTMAGLAAQTRDLDRTMSHIEKALEVGKRPETLAIAIAILNSAGLHETSRNLLQEALYWPRPLHPVRRIYWQRQLDALADGLGTNSFEADERIE